MRSKAHGWAGGQLWKAGCLDKGARIIKQDVPKLEEDSAAHCEETQNRKSRKYPDKKKKKKTSSAFLGKIQGRKANSRKWGQLSLISIATVCAPERHTCVEFTSPLFMDLASWPRIQCLSVDPVLLLRAISCMFIVLASVLSLSKLARKKTVQGWH